jgi:hypothetical protein
MINELREYLGLQTGSLQRADCSGFGGHCASGLRAAMSEDGGKKYESVYGL